MDMNHDNKKVKAFEILYFPMSKERNGINKMNKFKIYKIIFIFCLLLFYYLMIIVITIK